MKNYYEQYCQIKCQDQQLYHKKIKFFAQVLQKIIRIKTLAYKHQLFYKIIIFKQNYLGVEIQGAVWTLLKTLTYRYAKNKRNSYNKLLKYINAQQYHYIKEMDKNLLINNALLLDKSKRMMQQKNALMILNIKEKQRTLKKVKKLVRTKELFTKWLNNVRKMTRRKNRQQLNHLKKIQIKKLVLWIDNKLKNNLIETYNLFIKQENNQQQQKFHKRKIFASILNKFNQKKIKFLPNNNHINHINRFWNTYKNRIINLRQKQIIKYKWVNHYVANNYMKLRDSFYHLKMVLFEYNCEEQNVLESYKQMLKLKQQTKTLKRRLYYKILKNIILFNLKACFEKIKDYDKSQHKLMKFNILFQKYKFKIFIKILLNKNRIDKINKMYKIMGKYIYSQKKNTLKQLKKYCIRKINAESKINKIKQGNDNLIMTNCFKHYCYLISKIQKQKQSKQESKVIKQRQSILVYLLTKKSKSEKRELKIYFKRFKETLPKYNFSYKISLLNKIANIEKDKQKYIQEYC